MMMCNSKKNIALLISNIQENKCSSPSLNDCRCFIYIAINVNLYTVFSFLVSYSIFFLFYSKHAECIQQASNGYTCRCLAPYIDEGSSDRPGRICRYFFIVTINAFDYSIFRLHPCKVRNECDPNAICEETGDDS